MGVPGLSRCMDPIKNGDVMPASYVSLREGSGFLFRFFPTGE